MTNLDNLYLSATDVAALKVCGSFSEDNCVVEVAGHTWRYVPALDGRAILIPV